MAIVAEPDFIVNNSKMVKDVECECSYVGEVKPRQTAGPLNQTDTLTLNVSFG